MLTGYKTYITAAIGFVLAAAQLTGFMPAGVSVDPGSLIVASTGLIFARMGANTAAANAGK